jgi:aspartyl-tRNA(Asn)/glutamyl-tRNA(Gln) amidotransferase subunit A
VSSSIDRTGRMGLAGTCDRLARGTLTSAALVGDGLRRIAQVDGDVRAWVHVGDRDALLERARASDARRAAGRALSALDGVPVSIKDSQHVVGMPTAFGSAAAPSVRPDQPSPLVALLEAAGAIPLGKTALPEFSWKATTESPLTGVTRNPRYPAFSPGGSSGGAAASIAQGACALATGTDAAGSVRIPAAFTGTAGFKPSAGVALATAAVEGFRRIGHWGLHAASATDLRVAWDALFGAADAPAAPRWATVDPGPRIGAGARRFLDRSIARLTARLGAPSADVLPDWSVVDGAIHDLYLRGCHETFERIGPDRRALVDPGLRAFAARGARVDAGRLAAAIAAQARVRASLDAALASVDVLVLPTVAFEPPLSGDESPAEAHAADWLDWAQCTALTNLGGHPSLSLPGELDGVPYGLQLVGRHGEDAVLLALGARLEETLRPA